MERDTKRFQGLHPIIKNLLTIKIREKSKQSIISIKKNGALIQHAEHGKKITEFCKTVHNDVSKGLQISATKNMGYWLS